MKRKLCRLFMICILLSFALTAFTPARAEGSDLLSGEKLTRSLLYIDESAPEGASLQTASKTVSIPFPTDGTCFGDALRSVPGDSNQVAHDVYDCFIENTKKGNYSFTFSTQKSVTTGDLNEYVYIAWIAWMRDSPMESAVVKLTLKYGAYKKSDNSWTCADITFTNNSSTPAADRTQLQAAADSFTAQYNRDCAGSTTIEKYRYIHDFLDKTCYYNFDYDSSIYTENQKRNIHSAYGALVGLTSDGQEKGHIVCQGYGEAFKLLCSEVGLPCLEIIGEGKNAGSSFTGTANHMWNDIKLDGQWYPIDSTWDDLELSGSPVLRTYDYDYFGSAASFRGSSADHQAIPDNSDGVVDWQFNIPAQSTDSLSVYGWTPALLTIVSTADVTASVNSIEYKCYPAASGDINFSAIPQREILLTQDSTLSAACAVPSGGCIVNGAGRWQLSRSAAFSGTMFTVPDGCSLALRGVTVCGGSSASPLISTGSGTLTLDDAAVIGNSGSFGIVSAGPISVSGLCKVSGSTNGSAAANLKMNSGCLVTLSGHLTAGSTICLTPDGDMLCADASGLGSLTDADRSAFVCDDASRRLFWSGTSCSCSADVTSNEGSPVPVAHAANLTPATLGGQSVVLTNNTNAEQTITVFVAYYSAAGKLLGVGQTAAAVVSVGGTARFVLPASTAAEAGAQTARLLLLNGSTPLSDSVEFAA